MGDLSQLEIHLAPKTVFQLFGVLPITDSILMMWVVMAVMIVLALIIRLRLKYLPTGFQNFVEWSLGGLHGFMENVGGKEAKKHFNVFITFFLVILFSNWLALSLGFIAEKLELRAPTSDLNFTAAIALLAFVYFEYQAVKVHGFFGYLSHFVNFKGFKEGIMMGCIHFFVGLLHIISELVRPLALALRLFGNVFGGEIVLTVAFLLIKGIIPVPFMLLETMTGLIQAFVFSTLFLTFTSLNTAQSEEAHH